MHSNNQTISIYLLTILCLSEWLLGNGQEKFTLKISQLTGGEKHHFFGYIGQSLTTPWNQSERYVLGMQIKDIEDMPEPEDGAKIIVVDTHDGNKIIELDVTHAWNPQQGTMFYWNPNEPDNQFFFNDRDVTTGEVYTVLYDLKQRKRIREYRFKDTPIGNGGVSPDGSSFLAINYGRLARLRLVTGYPEALDWSQEEIAPAHDGIFVVDVKSGEKKLVVSYKQLAEKLKEIDIEDLHDGLFINHTLWNRESERVFSYIRAGWTNRKGGKRINKAFSFKKDGSELTLHTHKYIGGHPEWDEGSKIIGAYKNQSIYDVVEKKVIKEIEGRDVFPRPHDDISLSRNGNLLVNGYKDDKENKYVVYRRSDGYFVRSKGISKGSYGGDIRIDPAPRWNRSNDKILVPGIANNGTRQMFVISLTYDN